MGRETRPTYSIGLQLNLATCHEADIAEPIGRYDGNTPRRHGARELCRKSGHWSCRCIYTCGGRSVIPKSIPVLLATELWIDWIAAPRSRARPLGVSG